MYIGQTMNINQKYNNLILTWKNNKPEKSNLARLLENKRNINKVIETFKF